MKSGLWILVAVLIAGLLVGYALRDRVKTPTAADEEAELKAITELSDSEAKIDKLQSFMADFPATESKSRVYTLIAKEMLDALKDTTRFVGFARQTIEKETDAESRALMYYRLYNLKAESKPEEAALIGNELLAVPPVAGWVYNYIGYDLAEKGRDLDLALALSTKGIELAADLRDSAMAMDSRGFAYYKKAMYPEAVADLEAALKLYGEPDQDVLGHLANAYLRAGESDKAFASLRSILLMGEYQEARASVDSMVAAGKWTAKRRQQFEDALWQERLASAKPAIAFAMPTLAGETYTFDPNQGEIVIINFMSPT